ncbi:GNAT family N-acetyltransferase [Altererythrobacter sp. KTW20L]|uniref:GNAT family N-acetyltransferase n=1 Tax=Altererythrobacter sp. KTW20L TaxID=2942210 RepID=UPI0020C074CD|nr:GNAT family N-acetyltransferase [Altererythrobacter sp. KTW20L]MCL6251221.1 GNAT family N-acetyltransferase [Altererythrobacter sp. KTW20L]
MQLVIDRTMAEPNPPQLQTRNGLVLRLRAVTMPDRPFVDEFYAQLTIRDFRFRLVAGLKAVNPHQIIGRIEMDHRHAEHLLAFDPAVGKLVGSVIILADHGLANAEAAVVVVPQFRGEGIGWSLLRHAADLARERGLSSLRSIETLEDHEPLEIARTSGFQAMPYDADPTLMMLEATLA